MCRARHQNRSGLRKIARAGLFGRKLHSISQISDHSINSPSRRETISIKTVTSPGTAEVVHLIANKSKQAEEKKKNVAVRAAQDAKQEAAAKVHDSVEQINRQTDSSFESDAHAQSPFTAVHRARDPL